MRQSSPWLQVSNPNPATTARMFCFPFAGGGAQLFGRWHLSLPAEIEVCAVQLPGRETRMREAPITTAQGVVDALLPAMLPMLDKPFLLFGHSMGAILAYECAQRLEQEHALQAARLMVSARVAPHRTPPRAPLHNLPEAEFVEGLKTLNGTPPEVFENEELLSLITPMLRADFAVNEAYKYQHDAKLNCDLVAFGGLRDPETIREGLEDWGNMTKGAFSLRMVPGDHFYLQTAHALFMRMLSLEIYQAVCREAPILAAVPATANLNS